MATWFDGGVAPSRVVGGSNAQRGAALLVTMAMLALFSLFAVSFLSFMRLEQAAASNSLIQFKSGLISEAGYQRALVELFRSEIHQPFPTPAVAWSYRDDSGQGCGAGIPLAGARSPSFKQGEDAAGSWSGALSGSSTSLRSRYRLRVVDTASQLHLGLPSRSLGAMLDNLGLAIQEERVRRGQSAVDPIAGRGQEIVQRRDLLGGFKTKSDLRDILDEESYLVLKDYVSLYAWQDPSTLRVVSRDPDDGLARFEPEPRAPVNVNTASRPVLVAALTGIALPGSPPLSYRQAGAVADEIIRYRSSAAVSEGPLTSWREFYRFADSLEALPAGALLSGQVTALKVNANPNMTLVGLNPDRAVNLGADKPDLSFSTTEMCFMTMGIYEIESLGQVVAPDGEVIAQAVRVAVVRIYESVRLTTQAELEKARTEDTLGTATFPSPRAKTDELLCSSFSGYVQLQAEDPEPVDPATLVMVAGYANDIHGHVGSGSDGAVQLANGSVRDDVVPELGGDLLPDGVHQSAVKRRDLFYRLDHLDVEAGSLELWFKLDHDDRTLHLPLVQLRQPITPDVGIRGEVGVLVSGETLELRAERAFYQVQERDPSAASYPCPYALSRTISQASYQGKGVPNEWHHLLVVWQDGTDQQVYLDGERVPRVMALSAQSGPVMASPPLDFELRLGGGGAGQDAGSFRGLTIDDLVVRRGPPAFDPGLRPLPERFRSLGTHVVGRFEGKFPPVPVTVELGTLTWTEYLPMGYEGSEFGYEEFDARLGLIIDGQEIMADEGSDFLDAAGEGAGEAADEASKTIKEARKQAKEEAREAWRQVRDEARQARAAAEAAARDLRQQVLDANSGGSGNQRSSNDDDDDDDDGARGSSRGSRGRGTDAGPSSRNAVSEQLRQISEELHRKHREIRAKERERRRQIKSEERGKLDQLKAGDSQTTFSSPAGGATIVGSQTAVDLGRPGGGSGRSGTGLPGIVVAGEQVGFRVEFTYGDAGGAPLNVSPILDDITLTYRGPLQVISAQRQP